MTPDRRGGGGKGGGRPHGGGGRPPRRDERASGALDPERLVYGRHPVREALRGQRRVVRVHATANAAEDLAEALGAAGLDVHRGVDPGMLDALASTTDHQGVVAEVEPFPYTTLDGLISQARADGVAPFVLCLDQVTDPHNLGAIARVADASGATGILVPEHRSARVTGAAVKASAGALEHVQVAQCTNLAREIRRVKDAEIWAYAATERGTADWVDVDLAGGALVVLGAEGPGIRPNVLDACDVEVRIPMSGTVASLNVATVAAILAFEGVRQRRGTS